MTREQMAKHMEIVFDELRKTREAGQKEYAHDEGNAFRNFEALQSDLDIDRKKVLWIFMKKYFDGILAAINGYMSQREPVHGRIKDAIVYLILLDGMFAEEDPVVNAMRDLPYNPGEVVFHDEDIFHPNHPRR